MKSAFLWYHSQVDDLSAKLGAASPPGDTDQRGIGKFSLENGTHDIIVVVIDDVRIAVAKNPARAMQDQVCDGKPCLFVGAQHLFPA